MTKEKGSYKSGCIVSFTILLLSLILFGFISNYIKTESLLSYVLVYFLLQLTFKKIAKSRLGFKTQRTNTTLSYFWIFILILVWIQPLLPNWPVKKTTKSTGKIEYIQEGNDSSAVMVHHHLWKSNSGTAYQTDLKIRVEAYNRALNLLKNYNAKNSATFWGDLYHYLIQKTTDELDLIYKSFHIIAKEKQISRAEFATMVVSCIQEIPYSLVLIQPCDFNQMDENAKKVVLECPTCCIGNKTAGIQSPPEFLYNLKGDCDTRTVLLFAILQKFGFDVAILNSDYYKHSILGINIPASGTYKAYQGKRYYVWETTAKYYRIGELAASSSDINKWNIVLTSN